MITRRHLFEAAFPFHILLDRDLKIISLGRSLLKLGCKLDDELKLEDLFKVKRPAIELSFTNIVEHMSTFFILEGRDKGFSLKGQMLEVGYHGKSELVFLGSPVVRSLDEADALGLKMHDFAMHDSSLDYLVLMQVQESIHNDTKRLADKLLKETKARRKAQQELEETNISLEAMVLERTAELSTANKKLERFVGQLNASNDDLRVLNAVDKVLHGCRTVQDAFPHIIKAVRKLFPDSHGHIACYEEDLGCFEICARWGETEHHLGNTFIHEECPAIVGRKNFSGHGSREDVACMDLNSMGEEYYFCRPLVFDDVTIGLIHFHYGMDSSYEDEQEWLESRRTLAATLTEHMAMGLSNIRLRQKLKEESIRDPLTRLFNRRYMESRLEQEQERFKRDEKQEFGLLMLDVDHFKSFNDTYGHQAGDEVLIKLAALFSDQVRKGDVVCRYGGEEFLLILIRSSVENTAQRAEEIRKAVEEMCINYEGECLRISISCGVTGSSVDDKNIDTLIRRADDALYRAKEEGRNRVVIG